MFYYSLVLFDLIMSSLQKIKIKHASKYQTKNTKQKI